MNPTKHKSFAVTTFAAILTAAILILGLGVHHKASARIIGGATANTITSPDQWCIGGTSALKNEVCVDRTGRFIPTTTNNQSLGTSSLRFSNVYSVLGNFSGAVTAGTLNCTSASYTNLAATGDIVSGSGTLYASTASATTGNYVAAGSVTGGTGLTSTAGPIKPYKRSKAQLLAIAPAVGDVYVCSDCSSNYALMVATGTSAGAFGMMVWTTY